jgi:predicted DNA-binding transcriptional regulator YafY
VVDETNPTARALLCLQMLQDHPGITAERLARGLGCSSRAARRYVAILREAGIPVHAVRGPYGGYRLGSGVRPPPVMFSASEALALVMAVLDGHHDAGDESEPVGAALGKVVRALPAAVADQVQAIRRTTAPAPDRGAVRPDPSTTTTLVQACSQGRRVRLRYRSESGREWAAEVDPWAVVVRHGRWYLLCRTVPDDRHETAVRAYRLDRMQGVEPLDEAFEPPGDLDPVAALEAHLAVGWEYAVEVLVDAPVDRVRRYLSPALGRLEIVAEGRTRVRGSTSNPYWYAEQLAAIPAPFHVVSGPELRHTVRALGRRLLDASPSPDPDDGQVLSWGLGWASPAR